MKAQSPSGTEKLIQSSELAKTCRRLGQGFNPQRISDSICRYLIQTRYAFSKHPVFLLAAVFAVSRVFRSFCYDRLGSSESGLSFVAGPMKVQSPPPSRTLLTPNRDPQK